MLKAQELNSPLELPLLNPVGDPNGGVSGGSGVQEHIWRTLQSPSRMRGHTPAAGTPTRGAPGVNPGDRNPSSLSIFRGSGSGGAV